MRKLTEAEMLDVNDKLAEADKQIAHYQAVKNSLFVQSKCGWEFTEAERLISKFAWNWSLHDPKMRDFINNHLSIRKVSDFDFIDKVSKETIKLLEFLWEAVEEIGIEYFRFQYFHGNGIYFYGIKDNSEHLIKRFTVNETSITIGNESFYFFKSEDMNKNKERLIKELKKILCLK